MGGGPRVIVAMSGGVDSSVAACVLVEQGFDVIGVTLRLWDCEGERPPKRACCSVDGVQHARAVADRLSMPHYVVDGRKVFEQQVLKPAWEDYDRGRTPNPCVVCNEKLKFGLLAERAAELQAEFVATGHYARIELDADHGVARLLRARDRTKDQSYFLFSVGSERLTRTLFPLGEMTKKQVRQRARQAGFPNADIPESQDACLGLDQGGFAEALRRRFGGSARPGPVVDGQGNVLGTHRGVHTVTIGQRKGLGLSAGRRIYVTDIDGASGRVTMGENETLMRSGLRADGVRWAPDFGGGTLDAQVQIRYQHEAAPAVITPIGDGRVRVRFSEPQRAITPGQAVVFYRGQGVAGGGWIDSALQ